MEQVNFCLYENLATVGDADVSISKRTDTTLSKAVISVFNQHVAEAGEQSAGFLITYCCTELCLVLLLVPFVVSKKLVTTVNETVVHLVELGCSEKSLTVLVALVIGDFTLITSS